MAFYRFSLIVGLALVAGCSSADRGEVRIRGTETKSLYAQTFEQAYITSSRDGQYDIVLLQDSIDRSKPVASTSKPLEPVKNSDFRQVVHLRVYWQGSSGAVAREGIMTNATISWYVIGNETSSKPDMILYEGAGYVLLDEGKKSIRGQLSDPIGRSTLSGRVVARRNAPVVQEVLADLKTNFEPPNQAITDIR